MHFVTYLCKGALADYERACILDHSDASAPLGSLRIL